MRIWKVVLPVVVVLGGLAFAGWWFFLRDDAPPVAALPFRTTRPEHDRCGSGRWCSPWSSCSVALPSRGGGSSSATTPRRSRRCRSARPDLSTIDADLEGGAPRGRRARWPCLRGVVVLPPRRRPAGRGAARAHDPT